MPGEGRAGKPQGDLGILEDREQAFFDKQLDAFHARELPIAAAGPPTAKLGGDVSDDDAAAAAREVVNDDRSTGRQVSQPRSKRRLDANAEPGTRDDRLSQVHDSVDHVTPLTGDVEYRLATVRVRIPGGLSLVREIRPSVEVVAE